MEACTRSKSVDAAPRIDQVGNARPLKVILRVVPVATQGHAEPEDHVREIVDALGVLHHGIVSMTSLIAMVGQTNGSANAAATS